LAKHSATSGGAPLENLTRLRLKRFHLSIDDFGMGHSSLAQLRDIPFDELKIDRSFVHGARTDGTLCAIFGASLAMGERMHMTVVAEGVKDLADWQFLGQTGCHTAQGYFIARPMPAEDLPAWMAACPPPPEPAVLQRDPDPQAWHIRIHWNELIEWGCHAHHPCPDPSEAGMH
jgi:EAL domain-containing protein (putative c-di-GMP-specific phosphodiesterase class I)